MPPSYLGTMTTTKRLFPARVVAHRLGIPMAWLREEAKAGRLPSLKVGKRLLFCPEAVERALLQRAGEGASEAQRAEEGVNHG